MDRQPQRFLKTWIIACIAFALLVAVFNVLMDPYALFDAPRIAGFNARKPRELGDLPRTKAYDVLKTQPKTLLLGASVVHLGLDPESRAWPASNRPVYNLALALGGPYVSYRYLQHVLSQRHVGLVVLGLEFNSFLNRQIMEPPLEREVEARLAVTANNTVNPEQPWQHTRDLVQAALTLDALTNSTATLTLSFKGRESGFIADDAFERGLRRTLSATGSYPIVSYTNLYRMRTYFARHRDQAVKADVRRMLDLCESQGTRVILLINPVRADQLEILDVSGLWPAYEDWKRELVTLAAQYRGKDGGSRISLWDFSGYDAYSTEDVRSDGQIIHWFWESIHYTHALGDVMIERISGAGDEQFGTLLSPENVETHLATIREQRELYREQRPADVRRVRILYDAFVARRSQHDEVR